MNILNRIENDTGLKAKDIADKLGITRAYYSMIRNDIRPISKDVAIKIHEVFKIPLEEVFFAIEVNGELTDEVKGTNPTGTEG